MTLVAPLDREAYEQIEVTLTATDCAGKNGEARSASVVVNYFFQSLVGPRGIYIKEFFITASMQ